MKSLILSHPTGNANVRAALNGLAKQNMLFRFYTTIASFQGNALYKAGALRPLQEVRRRSYSPVLEPLTQLSPIREAGRILALKAGFNKLVKNETGYFSIDKVYHSLDKTVSKKLSRFKKSIDGVYCYEDGALKTFQSAKQNNLACIYDQPIGYWRSSKKILEHEKEKFPEWASTLGGLTDSAEKLSRKDEELKLANLILVASSFTATTLQEFPGKLAPVKVIPYGFPVALENRNYETLHNRKVKLLFVGGLSQRKGIASLFEAVDKMGDHVSLTVVGKKPKAPCEALDKCLSKHNWIPTLPHEKILKLMREHDVFVFPSVFEGFGLVITEAMSQGTPVITTERTCGLDFIKNGENGWLADAGSTEALVEKLDACLHRPQDIAMIGRQATETAKQRPWDFYGMELSSALSGFNLADNC